MNIDDHWDMIMEESIMYTHWIEVEAMNSASIRSATYEYVRSRVPRNAR